MPSHHEVSHLTCIIRNRYKGRLPHWMFCVPTGSVLCKVKAMLKFLYRKLLLTHSSSFRFQTVFLVAMLLYLLFLRLDPGLTFNCRFRHIELQKHFIHLFLSPQLFHLHSCGFSNYCSCSNRCGGPCLHPTIRPSPRAKNCENHLFWWGKKTKICLILIQFP